MSTRLYEPVDRDLSAREQWPQRPAQPGDSQAQPISLNSSDDDGDEDDDVSPELARDRKANDARLKNRFEAIFEKYGRDFTGVGDEIDLETGEIIVDNGHLENMQDEADAGDGDNVPLQFAHAFAENLKQEELSSSYESDADEVEDEDENDLLEMASEEDETSENIHDTIFSAREQSTDSNSSLLEPDDLIDPRLAQSVAAAHWAVTGVEGGGDGSTLSQSRLRTLIDDASRTGTTSQSGTPGVDLMRLPEIQHTMLALKSQSDKGSRPMDDDAIAALGKSIASQIARFMKRSDAKGKQKKRKDAAWEYPELPEDKRRRLGTSPVASRSRPHLESLKSAISPQKATASNESAPVARSKKKGKARPEPTASLWAPVAHPKLRRTKKRKQAEVLLGSSLDDPETVAAVDEIQDGQEDTIRLKRCSNCDAIATVTWRKGLDGADICNACGMYLYRYGLMKPPRSPTPPPEPPKSKPSAANTSKRVVQPPKEGSRHTKFTLEQDALVIKLKEFDNLNWEQIGRHFEGRSSFAVQCRYSKTLISHEKPEAARAREALVEQGFDFVQLERDKNGGFLKKEDELLLQLCPVPPRYRDVSAATKTHGAIVVDNDEPMPDSNEDQGPNFTAIAAEHFPNFTAQALQGRYVHHLERYVAAKDPKAKRKAQPRPDGRAWKQSEPRTSRATGVFFTPEESERLVQYREVNPISWEAVQLKLPGRSGMSIQKRYTRELAQRKATVAKGGKDPYSHLFKNGILSAIDKDAGIQEARKQVLKAMDRCKFTRVEDERIVRMRQEQKLGWVQMASQFPERTADDLQLRHEYLQAKLVKPAGSGGPVEDPSIYDLPISDAPQRSEARAPAEAHDAENAAEVEDQQPKLKGPLEAKATKYSKAEDKLILKLHFDQGLDWEQIATHLPGRTAKHIERRFTKKLLPDYGDYEPDDSSDMEGSDEEELGGDGDLESGEVEVLADRQPEFLWEQHAGALPDAEFPGLENLSDGELGPSSTFFTGSLKQRLERTKAGLGRHQRYTKREEEMLIHLRRAGLNWEGITADFPGRTAYELASYWHRHLKPIHAGSSTTGTSSTHQTALVDTTDGFVGGSRAMNLFTMLTRGGTALLTADEIPITPAVAKAKKAHDKTFEAANAKREGTRTKLSRRVKLTPRVLPDLTWLNQDGNQTVVPSIEPGECLTRLRDGILVQRFADPTPEVHGWEDSDVESEDEFSTASERSLSPAEYDDTGFAVVYDSSAASAQVENQNEQERLEMTFKKEALDMDASELDTDETDEWRPARRPRRSIGAAKRVRKSAGPAPRERKLNKRAAKRPAKKRTIRNTETPESVIEIKEESEDEQSPSELEQDDFYGLAQRTVPHRPQTASCNIYGQSGMEHVLHHKSANPLYRTHTPEQVGLAELPVYDTPARYDQQSHPYYAAPTAQMYSPIREELPMEREYTAESMETDPALLGEQGSGKAATSPEQDIAALNAEPVETFDSADSQAFDPDNADKMDLDSGDEVVVRTSRQRASEEPQQLTRRSARRGGASPLPAPALMSSATNSPPFSWSELVTMALKSIPSQRLSMNGIHLFLQDKFPYFKTCNAEWKKALQAFLDRSSDFAQNAERRGEDSWTFAAKEVKVPEKRRTTPRKRKEVVPDIQDTDTKDDESILFEPEPIVVEIDEEPEPTPANDDYESKLMANSLESTDMVNNAGGDARPNMGLDEVPTATSTKQEGMAQQTEQAVSASATNTEWVPELPTTTSQSIISLMPERRRRGRPRKLKPRPLKSCAQSVETKDLAETSCSNAADVIDPALSVPPESQPALGSSSTRKTIHLDDDDIIEVANPYATCDKAYVKARPAFKRKNRGGGGCKPVISAENQIPRLDTAHETSPPARPKRAASTAEQSGSTDPVQPVISPQTTRATSVLLEGANICGTYDKAYAMAHPDLEWKHVGRGRYRRKAGVVKQGATPARCPLLQATPQSSARAPNVVHAHRAQLAAPKQSTALSAPVPWWTLSTKRAVDVPVLVHSSALSRGRNHSQQSVPSSDTFRDPESSSSDISRTPAVQHGHWPPASAAAQASVRTPVPSSPAPRTIFDRLAGYSQRPAAVPQSSAIPQNAGSALFNRHLNRPQRAASQTPVQYSRAGRAVTPGIGPSRRAVTPVARASSVGLGTVALRRALAREATPFNRRTVETPPPSRDADSEEDELA